MAAMTHDLKVDQTILVVAPVHVFNHAMRVWLDTYCLINQGVMANVCSRSLATGLSLNVDQVQYDTDLVFYLHDCVRRGDGGERHW